MATSDSLIKILCEHPQGMTFDQIKRDVGFFATADGIESLLNNLKRNKVVEVISGKWIAAPATKNAYKENMRAKEKIARKKKAKKKAQKKAKELSKAQYKKKKDEHLNEIKASVRNNFDKKINTLKEIAKMETADVSSTINAVIHDLKLAAKSMKNANL